MPQDSTLPPDHGAYARALAPYLAAMDELAREVTLRVVFERAGGAPPRVGAVGQAVDRLSSVIRDAQSTADIVGRRDTLKAADTFAKAGSAPPGASAPPTLFPMADPGGAPLPRVPFTEAAADVIAREPRLAQSVEEVAKAYNEAHGFALAHSSSLKVTERVQKAVGQAILQGSSVADGASTIRGIAKAAGEDMAKWTQAYAETCFRTSVSTAYSAGRFRAMADPAVAFAIGALKFSGPTSTPPQGDTRPNHAAAVGLIAAADDPVWDKLAPPIGYNSFAPSMRCSGTVNAVSEAFYSGPLVEIKTRKGRRLSLTVNHPVLTADRGFVPAGDVREGDHLVAHLPSVERLVHRSGNDVVSSPEVLRRAVHDQEVIPGIKDLFRATRADGTGSVRVERARTLPLDFDGHAARYDAEVNIHSLDWLLSDDLRNPEASSKGSFEAAYEFGPHSTFLVGSAARMAAACVAGPALLGCGAQLDSVLPKPVVHDITAGSDFLADLEYRNPGAVAVDDVILVDFHFYEGHVYDLQSPLGIIVAEGLVVSNCRHSLAFVSWPELQRRGLVLPTGKVRPARIPPGAHADEGFTHTGRPDRAIYGGGL